MAVDFKTSETKKNIMRAFAGESQARNRYTFASSKAKGQKLQAVAAIFDFTAGQEKEHAEVFLNMLKQCEGENIQIDGTYPVDTHDDVLKLLRAAQHNEYQEYSHDYAGFAGVAAREGFDNIANVFNMIASVEKTHGDRFGRFADMLANGQLFVASSEVDWMCLNCGYVWRGKSVPEICPVCSHDKGYFIRLELAPYMGNIMY